MRTVEQIRAYWSAQPHHSHDLAKHDVEDLLAALEAPRLAWVVTRCDYSQEGLEGCFFVYEGVAGTLREALCIIDPGNAVHRYPVRYVVTKGERGVLYVVRKDMHERYHMGQPTGDLYESEWGEWRIHREVLNQGRSNA